LATCLVCALTSQQLDSLRVALSANYLVTITLITSDQSTICDNWIYQFFNYLQSLAGQFADKPTRGQSSRRLVNSQTSQLAEMFYLKFGVYNGSKFYFG